MSMNENLPEPPTDAGLPRPEAPDVPIDPPAVEDIAATVQETVAEAAPVEAPAAFEAPAEEAVAAGEPVAEDAPVEAPAAFEAPPAPEVDPPAPPLAPPAPPAPPVAPLAPPAPPVAPPAPPAPEAFPVAPPVAPPAPPAPTMMAAAPVAAAAVATFPNGKPTVDVNGRPASPKSRLAAAILAWFLGVIGVHRFYVGKVGTGILMILTLGGLGIWALIDFIMILVGSFKDKQSRVLSNW